MNLARAIDQLSVILERENAALEAVDFAGAGALLASKHAASEALAAAWRAVSADELPQRELEKLAALAEKNRILLNGAMRVQRRVLDLVARAARATQPAGRYGAKGQIASRPASPRSLAARL